jgi:hypothetical protein
MSGIAVKESCTKGRATKAPKLKTLKTRPCTLEELQAALVQLIELHNGMHDEINRMISSGRIRSSREALMNTPYGPE